LDNRLLINRQLQQPQQVREQQRNVSKKEETRSKGSFKELLTQKLQNEGSVKFSRHAQTRLMSREIVITSNDLDQLKDGIRKAAAKGARDTLILVKDVAYVVSIENNTVITAVNNESFKDRVFTNIDSAVFMD
jgi:flagellar operon protein